MSGKLNFEQPMRPSRASFRGECSVGAYTYFNGECRVTNASIGRYCSIAEGVLIGPQAHSLDRLSTHPFAMGDWRTFRGDPIYRVMAKGSQPERRRTEIGHDVWIGARAIILPGIRIGHGAVVGAGAVVTRDVEPYSIVAGIPARPLRKRFDEETIDRLLQCAWWSRRLDLLDVPDYENIHSILDKVETLPTLIPKATSLG